MSPRIEYHVLPARQGWMVKVPGDGVEELYASRTEALTRARELGSKHPSARIRVLDGQGRVEGTLLVGSDVHETKRH